MTALAVVLGADAAAASLLVLFVLVLLILLGDDDLPGPRLCYSGGRAARGFPGANGLT